MKITRLQIIIEPLYGWNDLKQLLVEVVVDGVHYTHTITFEDCDFESRFDHLMEYARSEILKISKQKPV